MMNLKRVTVATCLVGTLAVTGVVSAAGGFGIMQKFHTKGGNGIPVEDVLGITREELAAQLKEGKDVAQLLTEAGKLDEFKANMAEQLKARLAKSVEDGKMTQEQADEVIAKHDERIANGDMFLKVKVKGENGERPVRSERPAKEEMPEGEARPERPAMGGALVAVEDVLGITREDLTAQLKEGKTIVDLLTEAGKLDEYKARLVEQQKARLDKLVEDGKMTQEQADEALAKCTEFMAGDDFMMGGRVKNFVGGKFKGEKGERPECPAKGEMPEGMTRPGWFAKGEVPEGPERPERPAKGEMPEGMTRPGWFAKGEMPEGMTRPGRPAMSGGMVAVEDVLGITREELAAQLKEGKTVVDLLTEAGKLDEFKAALTAKQNEIVAKMLEEGKITQEQADEMLAMHEKCMAGDEFLKMGTAVRMGGLGRGADFGGKFNKDFQRKVGGRAELTVVEEPAS